MSFILLSIPTLLFAQEDVVEMADVMRNNGKIYVVVTIVSVILTGILIFLISIDRRLRKIEKERKKE